MGKDVANGYTLVTPMFQGIGLEGIDVQSINPVGAAPSDGSLTFQILNTSRVMTKTFYYYGFDAGVDPSQYGWYDGDGTFEKPDAYEFKPGDAMMLYMGADNAGVQVAGQVPDKDAVVAMQSPGYYLIGNPMPIAIDAQDFIVGTGAASDGSLTFQVLGADRKMIKTFYYYGEDAGVEPSQYGWYDGDGTFESPDTYAIQPGDSVMLYAPSAMTITIKAPVIK